MTSDELKALAGRVMALAGPDRETDRAILLALGYSWRGMAYWFQDDSHRWKGDTHFTASLDAAMTLAKMCERPLSVLRWAMDMLRDASVSVDSLPRYLTAAALLAKAAQIEGEGK